MAAKFLSHGHGDVSVKAESEVILSGRVTTKEDDDERRGSL
jgi:hypothetical protein